MAACPEPKPRLIAVTGIMVTSPTVIGGPNTGVAVSRSCVVAVALSSVGMLAALLADSTIRAGRTAHGAARKAPRTWAVARRWRVPNLPLCATWEDRTLGLGGWTQATGSRRG